MSQDKKQSIKSIKSHVQRNKLASWPMLDRVVRPNSNKLFRKSFVLSLIMLLTLSAIAVLLHTLQPLIPKVAQDDQRIMNNDRILKQYIKQYGAEKTIVFVKTLPVDCHQRVHKVGRLSYELKGNDAFSVPNGECMSGYTHGVTEAYFNKNGTNNLAKSLGLICRGKQNGFYAHQCFHGVGHGLMAYNDYDLPAALKGCGTLPPNHSNKESCYTGVFMENVVGAISIDEAKKSDKPEQFHSSEWLSDDPLFPCNAVDKEYKSACYIFQTSRMIQVLNNYEKVAAACASIETSYRSICFSSMGRDLSNTYQDDHASIERACSYTNVETLQLTCIDGASQDKFWHESEQNEALNMCKELKNPNFKEKCYRTINARARDIIPTRQASQAFCAKYEPEYSRFCIIKL